MVNYDRRVRIWANLSVTFKFALCVTSPSDYPTHVFRLKPPIGPYSKTALCLRIPIIPEIPISRAPPPLLPSSQNTYHLFASNRADRIWENLGINAWISPMRVLPLRPENEQRLQPDCPDLG